MVVIDKNKKPVTVSPTGNDEQNIILWMDHRAEKQADFINKLGHEVLDYVGGKVSLEMEIPKLLWIKQNLPETWSRAEFFFDLPDFLTWKATDCQSRYLRLFTVIISIKKSSIINLINLKIRSLCSLVCKWNFVAGPNKNNHWCNDYLEKIGLSDLNNDNSNKIGNLVKPPGYPVGDGLSVKAAKELGLLEKTPVGTSIIDAHAGGIGMLGCSAPNISSEFTSRLSKK